MKLIRTNIYRRFYRNGRSVWMVRWWDEGRHGWRAIKGGNSLDEAKICDAKLRQDLMSGLDPTPERRITVDGTLGDYIDRFYKSPAFLVKSEQWQDSQKCQLDGAIREQLGVKKMQGIRREAILNFYLGLKDNGLSNATIRKYHFTLCAIGDVFLNENPKNQNPFRAIKDFGKLFPKEAPTRSINFLTEEEILDLLEAARKSKNKLLFPFVKFLANTGMRRSEALSLKWADVDEKGGFIHLRKTKNGQARVIPLEPDALAALNLMDRRTKYVFTDPEYKQRHKDSFLKPLKTAANRAGIKKRIDLHTLRHSYGSNKIRAGWGLKKVSIMLGHSDISITAKIYTHLLDGDLKVCDELRATPKSQVPATDKNKNSSEGQKLDEQTIMAQNMEAMTAMTATTAAMMHSIQQLQAQLSALQAQGLPGQSQVSSDATVPITNIPEQLRIVTNPAPISGENTPPCYANATQTKKIRQVKNACSSSSPGLSCNIIGVGLKKWRAREGSNHRPSAPEADALSS